MSEFVFSAKNEVFRDMLQRFVKALRLNNQEQLEAVKAEYAQYKITVGYQEDTDKVILLAEGAKPCLFDAKEYDTIPEGEIVAEESVAEEVVPE